MHAELLVQMRDVVADGLLGNPEFRGDLCIAATLAQQCQGLAFALTQAAQPDGASRIGWIVLTSEFKYRLLEVLPCGFVFEQDMIARFKQHEI